MTASPRRRGCNTRRSATSYAPTGFLCRRGCIARRSATSCAPTIGERGFATIEFVAAIAVLMLPVVLLVSAFPTWSERKELAVVAAREAARTYVLTHDAAKAQQVVDEIEANYDLEDSAIRLELRGDPDEPGGDVTAVVHVGVPVTVIPIMNADADAFTVTNQHTEVVDRYRSIS